MGNPLMNLYSLSPECDDDFCHGAAMDWAAQRIEELEAELAELRLLKGATGICESCESASVARADALAEALRQVRPQKHGEEWGDGWQPWLQLDPVLQARIIDEALAQSPRVAPPQESSPPDADPPPAKRPQ